MISMIQNLAVPVFALALFIPPSVDRARDKPVRAADVPRQFEGSFEWKDANAPYALVLKIDEIKEKDGTIHFSGSHHYVPGDYKMKVDGTIDAKSRRITLRESAPVPDGAITDGSFEGTISTDLATIEAVWTTRSTGSQGNLKVRAK